MVSRGVEAAPRRKREASRWQATQAGSLVAWRPRARRALSLLCLLAEVRDDWHQARWAGPAQVRPRWAWWAPGKCPGESLSLSFILVFLFLLFCFDLVWKLNHFKTFCKFLCELRELVQGHMQTYKIFEHYFLYSRNNSNPNILLI